MGGGGRSAEGSHESPTLLGRRRRHARHLARSDTPPESSPPCVAGRGRGCRRSASLACAFSSPSSSFSGAPRERSRLRLRARIDVPGLALGGHDARAGSVWTAGGGRCEEGGARASGRRESRCRAQVGRWVMGMRFEKVEMSVTLVPRRCERGRRSSSSTRSRTPGRAATRSRRCSGVSAEWWSQGARGTASQ
jgi:hypothetical protein